MSALAHGPPWLRLSIGLVLGCFSCFLHAWSPTLFNWLSSCRRSCALETVALSIALSSAAVRETYPHSARLNLILLIPVLSASSYCVIRAALLSCLTSIRNPPC